MLFYSKFKSVKFNLKIIEKKSKKNQVSGSPHSQ